MTIRATLLCIGILYFFSVKCQNSDRKHHATLQDMIDYAKQFEHNRSAEPQRATHLPDSKKLEENPVLRELFKEFLLQYQQLTGEQKTEAPSTITTTTEAPFKVEIPTFPAFDQDPVQPRKSVFLNAQPVPETTPIPHNRRLSPRRKINSPESPRSRLASISSTTPFSTLLTRGHFPRHETITETATPLKQKYFSVDIQTTKRPVVARRPTHNVHLVQQTTSATQLVNEEPEEVNQPPRLAPKLHILQNVLKTSTKLPPKAPSKIEEKLEPKFDEQEFRRQAESAKYEFASEIDDEISGNLHQREEVRDGLAVKGKYSYSDGYYKRTVHYEADEKGYRVVKEEVEPLSGPQTNPDGQAKVSSYVAGNTVNYQITKDDIAKKNRPVTFNEVKTPQDYDEEN